MSDEEVTSTVEEVDPPIPSTEELVDNIKEILSSDDSEDKVAVETPENNLENRINELEEKINDIITILRLFKPFGGAAHNPPWDKIL